MKALPSLIRIDLDLNHDYTVRFMNPGDDLSFFYDTWWSDIPPVYNFKGKDEIAFIEFSGQMYRTDPTAVDCVEDENTHHLKLQGNHLSTSMVKLRTQKHEFPFLECVIKKSMELKYSLPQVNCLPFWMVPLVKSNTKAPCSSAWAVALYKGTSNYITAAGQDWCKGQFNYLELFHASSKE